MVVLDHGNSQKRASIGRKMIDLAETERQCIAKIASIEVVRECLGMASIELSDLITRLEHVMFDAKGLLDFGLALKYTVKYLAQFDIRVTRTPKK